MSTEDILNQILQRLDVIERHIDIKPKSLYDNIKPTVTIADAAKLLGCREAKVRQYIKWKMLETFKLGSRRMIVSNSLRKLIKSNTKAQNLNT